MKKMTICYFGIYNPNYSRNRILLKGLRENGVNVIECCTDLSGVLKYWDLIKKHWKIRKDYDIMITGFVGHHSTILAKFLTRKPVIFDAYLSLYNALIFDRKESPPKSLRAKYYWFLDWLPCKLADKVLLDTNEHINYFVDTFKSDRKKFIRVFIGADDNIFFPSETRKDNDDFIVGFHGLFVPTQGAEHIVRAAKILEKHKDIKFIFIGSGKDYQKVLDLDKELNPGNTKFFGRVPYQDVPGYVAQMDVVLGNFGDSRKTELVIPNKSYEAAAMAKPQISAEVLSMKEFFTDRENILFCKRADSQDLADKILEIKSNKELRDKIAENSHQVFIKKALPKVLAKQLLVDLKLK